MKKQPKPDDTCVDMPSAGEVVSLILNTTPRNKLHAAALDCGADSVRRIELIQKVLWADLLPEEAIRVIRGICGIAP